MLFIQVCTDPASMHRSSVQGKMQSPLFSAALQDRPTAKQCHCIYIYEALLFVQVCSLGPNPNSAAAQNRLAAGIVPMHSHLTYGDLLFIQVCSDPAPLHCSSVQGKMQSPLIINALQYRLTTGSVSLHLHTWRCALYTGVQ